MATRMHGLFYLLPGTSDFVSIGEIPNAEGDMYSTQNQERAGVLMKSISLNQPGVYEISCQYPDGRTHPQIVLGE